MKLILHSFVVVMLFIVAGTSIGQSARGQSLKDDPHSKPSTSDTESKANSQPFRIAIKDFSFGPVSITVPAGAKVTWVNKDEEPHKVVSVDEVFKSTAIDTDGEFAFVFNKPGTFKYFCSIHPRMVGTVVVEDPKPNGSMK